MMWSYTGEYWFIPSDLSGLPANRRYSNQGRTRRQSREVARRRKWNKEAQQQDEERQSRQYQRNQIARKSSKGMVLQQKRRQKRLRLLPQIESPRVLEEEKMPLEKAPFLLSRPASAEVTTSDYCPSP